MKSFKIVYRISSIYFRRWLSDYRILSIFVILSLMTYTYTSETINFASRVGYKVSPWFFAFMTTTRIFRLIYMILFILYISGFPNSHKQNTFIHIRAGKLKLLEGEVLYIIRASICYILFLVLSPIIMYIKVVEWNMDWGKVFGTLATTNATEEFSNSLLYDSKIVERYMPLDAIFRSIVLMVQLCIFIGLLMFVINLATRSKFIGGFVTGFLVLLDFFLVTIPEGKQYLKYSPVSWSNLKYIDYMNQSTFPKFMYCFVLYSIMIIILLLLLLVHYKKYDRELY